jgi:pimeloyl-ACP methyl ester carboxylesterase
MFTVRGKTAHLAWYRTTESPADVTFLHGFSDSAQCWEPLLTHIPDIQALAIDARGHGNSALPPGPVNYPQLRDDAALVLSSQPREGGTIVVGHSMGAMTAAYLAATRPDLIRAIVLEDPPTGEPRPTQPPEPADPADPADPTDPAKAAKAAEQAGPAQAAQPAEAAEPAAASAAPEAGDPPSMPRWLADVRSLDLPARIAQARSTDPAWPEDELEPWATSKAQVNPHLFDRPFLTSDPLTDLLAATTCPVLLIHGDTDRGSLISPDYATRCAEAAAGQFRSVHIPNVGHSVHRDNRPQYLAELTKFLNQHR